MAVKNTTQVLIDGKIITLGGYESPEYLQKVAAYLNQKISELSQLSLIHIQMCIRDRSKAERQHFEELITHFPFTVTGTRGFREAIITQGGVSVKEIRPGTMETKKKEGLYFVGEVLDLDALTGGFNLQIAWASAHAAAEEIRAKAEQE